MEVILILVGIWIGFSILRGVWRYLTVQTVQGQSRSDALRQQRLIEESRKRHGL